MLTLAPIQVFFARTDGRPAHARPDLKQKKEERRGERCIVANVWPSRNVHMVCISGVYVQEDAYIALSVLSQVCDGSRNVRGVVCV